MGRWWKVSQQFFPPDTIQSGGIVHICPVINQEKKKLIIQDIPEHYIVPLNAVKNHTFSTLQESNNCLLPLASG